MDIILYLLDLLLGFGRIMCPVDKIVLLLNMMVCPVFVRQVYLAQLWMCFS